MRHQAPCTNEGDFFASSVSSDRLRSQSQVYFQNEHTMTSGIRLDSVETVEIFSQTTPGGQVISRNLMQRITCVFSLYLRKTLSLCVHHVFMLRIFLNLTLWTALTKPLTLQLPRKQSYNHKFNQPWKLKLPILDPWWVQTKGTTSFGERHNKSHTTCRRCGKVSFHIQKKRCSSCAYPNPKRRSFNWSKKAQGRRTTGTGRMRYMKSMTRRFKNGFREGTQAKKQVAN